MKKIILFLTMLLLTINLHGAISNDSTISILLKPVSHEEAIRQVKFSFSGKDVDYYECIGLDSIGTNTNLKNKWIFFIDADPMASWEHECYLVSLPKSIPWNQEISRRISITELRLPPQCEMSVIDKKKRFSYKDPHTKPYVAKSNAYVGSDVAQRTYAVIISGGINPENNHERYWNDCSFIYQTLVNKYAIPKSNITALMADGTNSAPDLRLADDSGYISTPLDLDFDNIPDIKYSATKFNIINTFNNLKSKLNKDDHLFIYVIDHGGYDKTNKSSYICLWNSGTLYDKELASILSDFTAKYVNVNVVLGQCNSGGFVDDLNQAGCVVATACAENESSYGCYDIPYDEFVYHWTSAVNETDMFGQTILSDANNNGIVSMSEAFSYALAKDVYANGYLGYYEHPQYNSNPISVGEDLAFNMLPEAVDLYIRDTVEDTGVEPNNFEVSWHSPDIWIRNKDDGIETHENPYYSVDHLACVIYVRIHNRGKETYTGGKWLHAYWGLGSTALNKNTWTSHEVYNGQITGAKLLAQQIQGPIAPGESVIISVPWALPKGLIGTEDENDTPKHHFCILARILDTHSDDKYNPAEGTEVFGVRLYNDVSQKNVSVVSTLEAINGTSVFVRNINNTDSNYTLELRFHSTDDALRFDGGSSTMRLSNTIYNAWEKGGRKTNGNAIYDNAGLCDIVFPSGIGTVNDINLASKEFDTITMYFNGPSTTHNQKDLPYTFDLIQRDSNGNVVGGESFIVRAKSYIKNPITINSSAQATSYILEAETDDANYIRWLNNDGTKIGTGKTIEVFPTRDNCHYTAEIIINDNEFAHGEITLAPIIGIKSAELNSSHSSIIVKLISAPHSGVHTLNLSSITSGTIVNHTDIAYGTDLIDLDVSHLPFGSYAISYSVNGNIIDSCKFNK